MATPCQVRGWLHQLRNVPGIPGGIIGGLGNFVGVAGFGDFNLGDYTANNSSPLINSNTDSDGDGIPDRSDENPFDANNTGVVVNGIQPEVTTIDSNYSFQAYRDSVAFLFRNGVNLGEFDIEYNFSSTTSTAGTAGVSVGADLSGSANTTFTVGNGLGLNFSPHRQP